jgi:hypothetical protein
MDSRFSTDPDAPGFIVKLFYFDRARRDLIKAHLKQWGYVLGKTYGKINGMKWG